MPLNKPQLNTGHTPYYTPSAPRPRSPARRSQSPTDHALRLGIADIPRLNLGRPLLLNPPPGQTHTTVIRGNQISHEALSLKPARCRKGQRAAEPKRHRGRTPAQKAKSAARTSAKYSLPYRSQKACRFLKSKAQGKREGSWRSLDGDELAVWVASKPPAAETRRPAGRTGKVQETRGNEVRRR